MDITAEDLILEYAKNETEANQKYLSKNVRVTGELFFVGESYAETPMILFRSPESVRLQLGIYFEGSWDEKDKLLIEGTPVTIEGIVREKDFGDFIEISGNKITNLSITITFNK